MPVPAVSLHYIGQGAELSHWVAGWPAEDHEEPDHDLAAAKVRSGLYEAAGSADEDRDLSQRTQRKLERAADAGEERQAVLAGEPLPGAETSENAPESPAVVSDTSTGNIPTESQPGGSA